jgi:hypothetical protein
LSIRDQTKYSRSQTNPSDHVKKAKASSEIFHLSVIYKTSSAMAVSAVAAAGWTAPLPLAAGAGPPK